MTHNDYTKEILNIKDKNVFFDENCLEIKYINGVETKIFHGKLTYIPFYCEYCGCINEGYNDIIKWNWKRNCKVKHTKVCNYNSIVLIDKQRFLCKHCHHTFIARSNMVDFHKHISNDVITSIKLDLMNKISEKDIAKNHNVSHNFVNRILNSFKYNFNNGVIEDTNNLIKCIKRIAFGYRSFYHFKTRILLVTGTYSFTQ